MNLKFAKTFPYLLFLLVLIAIIFSLRLTKDKSPEMRVPIKIGLVAALTGVGSSDGTEILKGAELAVEEINNDGGILGSKVKLIPEDVSLDKLRVVSTATNKLIDVDQVTAIVGPQWDEPGPIMTPIIETAQIPTISPEGSPELETETNYDYFFSTWYSDKIQIETIVRFAQMQNWNHVAIVRPVAGGYYQYTRNLMYDISLGYNLEIVEDINVNDPLKTDF